MVTMMGSGALLGYLTMVDSLAEALVFALVWGVFSGAVGTMENMMLAQYYGRDSYGSLLGVVLAVPDDRSWTWAIAGINSAKHLRQL